MKIKYFFFFFYISPILFAMEQEKKREIITYDNLSNSPSPEKKRSNEFDQKEPKKRRINEEKSSSEIWSLAQYNFDKAYKQEKIVIDQDKQIVYLTQKLNRTNSELETETKKRKTFKNEFDEKCEEIEDLKQDVFTLKQNMNFIMGLLVFRNQYPISLNLNNEPVQLSSIPYVNYPPNPEPVSTKQCKNSSDSKPHEKT